MGLYSRYVFPRLMELTLSSGQIRKIRSAVLADASGEIFEVGFGTGLNLPHYPKHVTRITAVDPHPGVNARARKRIAESAIEVRHHMISGEQIPMDDLTFDTVVCTFTLCSIPDAQKALRELHRVLKPEGRLIFVEHGLADDPAVRKWQHRLTPLQKIVGDGCHFNRDIRAMIQSERFRFEKLENYYLHRVPRFGGYLYQGVAVKE
ncbi:MAG: ubiquinone/menaquinone biosynthesis methyltransferase [Candidatus Hydrogenedentota bacterium]